jgi:hypothetical protein
MAILAFMNEKINSGPIGAKSLPPTAASVRRVPGTGTVATEHHQHNAKSSFVVVDVDVESSSAC